MAGRTVTIELGGKERHLKYDLNAIAEIGERLKITISFKNFVQDLMSQQIPFSALRVILWAGLRHEDPDLTPEQVGAWVDLDNVQQVTDRFFTLFGDRFSAKVEQAVKQTTEMTERSQETSDSPTSSELATAPSESSPISSGV